MPYTYTVIFILLLPGVVTVVVRPEICVPDEDVLVLLLVICAYPSVMASVASLLAVTALPARVLVPIAPAAKPVPAERDSIFSTKSFISSAVRIANGLNDKRH